jgi:uncharacterized protein YjbJ (UPF0337 family)
LAGKTKETAGKVTSDDRLEAGGRTQHDTAEGKEAVKSAVDKAKGGARDIKSRDERKAT